MQRRHFEAIAGAIRELLGDPLDTDDHRAVAEAMARVLAGTNPAFDRARFLKACGVTA